MLTRCARRHLSYAVALQPRLSAGPRVTYRPDPSYLQHRSHSTYGRRPKDDPLSRLRRHRILPILAITLVASLAGSLYRQQDRSDEFVRFVLVKKEPVSSTASIFYLQPKKASEKAKLYQDAWRKGIWNFQFKQPQIQVVRSYTPLPPLADHDASPLEGSLRFLIRAEQNGEVSGWLHRLPVGYEINMRGPNLEYQIPSTTKHIVFLAGGTGIASALQTAYALLGSDQTQSDSIQATPRISILWASRRREDCLGGVSDHQQAKKHGASRSWFGWLSSAPDRPVSPSTDEKGLIVKELESLKATYPGQLTVDYFVDAENTFIDPSSVAQAISDIKGKDGAESMHSEIVVSGPEGFIKYLAGPKQWRNGREEQGPVQGVVSQALQRSSSTMKVWKV